MSRQRVIVKIDSVTLSSGTLSRRDLASAIEAELGALIHQQPTAVSDPSSARIRSLDGGRINGRGTAEGVGRAVARAAMGALGK